MQDRKDPEGDLVRVLEARGYTGTVTMLDGNTGMAQDHYQYREGRKAHGAGKPTRGGSLCEVAPF